MTDNVVIDGVGIDSDFSEPSLFGDLGDDPFAANLEKIRTYGGLSPTVKKRLTRQMEKAAGLGGAQSTEIDRTVQSWQTGYKVLDVAIPPYNLDYLAQIYEINSPHYAAVNAKVSNVVGLGYGWVQTRKTADKLERLGDDQERMDKARRKLEAFKNELDDWLEDTNDEDSFIETLIKVWIDFEATGNGYLEVGRTNRGDIGYIGHIPAVTMRVRLAKDGFVQLVNGQARFFRNFGDLKTADPIGNDKRPNEILHVKQYTPSSTYYGIPDIVSAKSAVAGSEFASRYNLDYFEHKAVPRYVITLSGGELSADAERKVVNFFRGNLKGKHHRTLYIPLPKTGTGENVEFKMEPVEANTQDASFVEYHKLNLNLILMAHRVPVTKVGIADGASVAVAKDADKTFKEQVCGPRQTILEKKLNRIVKEKTDAFKMKLNELTLTDAIDQAKIDQIEVTLGIAVANEVRARKGLPGLKNGNKTLTEQEAEAAEKLQSQQAQSQQAAAQMKANMKPTRQRDSARAANAADSAGGSRNAKGEGRQQA